MSRFTVATCARIKSARPESSSCSSSACCASFCAVSGSPAASRRSAFSSRCSFLWPRQMQKFRRRLARVLDQRCSLHFSCRHQSSRPCRDTRCACPLDPFRTYQRVVEVARQNVAFLVVLVDGSALAQLPEILVKALFNRPHQAFGHQQRNVALESLIHRSLLYILEQRLQPLESTAILQRQRIQKIMQIGVPDLLHLDRRPWRRRNHDVVVRQRSCGHSSVPARPSRRDRR